MLSINDGWAGMPYGWVCWNFIDQMELKFYGCSNYSDGYNQGFWDPQTNMDSVAKFNIPFYFFGDEANTGVAHAIGGVLVGSRVNADSVSYNPLNFNDWFFIGYNTDDRVYPGDWNMNFLRVL